MLLSGPRRYVLALLLAINLLNYIDRQVLFAVFPLIKADLRITDTALGFLGSAFMLCYMVSAPLFAWLGDHGHPQRLAAAGLGVWSLATAATGIARNYGMLLAARTTVGIGEASFGTVSPGFLTDFFPREHRGRVLAYFYLAIPVGSAIGYLAGGLLGHQFGWHAAFFMVGMPGLFLVFPLLRLQDPAVMPSRKLAAERLVAYRALLTNRAFILNTLAMAAMTFALGGLAQWFPSFLYRIHGLDVAQGNTLFGLTTVLSGISGTLTGGWLGDRMRGASGKGYLLVSGWGLVIGAPIAVFTLLSPDLVSGIVALFLAEFFLFLNTGPLNTVIVNVTRPGTRAMAFAINIFAIHALGDAISPTIIGYLSDRWGLQAALLITPVAIVVAALFCFLCSSVIKENTSDLHELHGAG